MANVIVFGAEVNWWHGAPRRGRRACRGPGPDRATCADAAARGGRRGRAAVRVLALPVVAELGDRPLLARRDEDRVVAEALVAARARVAIVALEDAACRAAPRRRARARRARRRSARGGRRLPSSSLEQPSPTPSSAQRAEAMPGRAAERLDLDPRVLAEHPVVRAGRRARPNARLGARVLVVGRAGLRRAGVARRAARAPSRAAPPAAPPACARFAEASARLQGRHCTRSRRRARRRSSATPRATRDRRDARSVTSSRALVVELDVS